MHVFVAGATGALGLPLCRRLVQAGHRVTGLTRRPAKRAELEALGAEAAVADALDAPALEAALRAAAPSHLVHLLTALPPAGPLRARDLGATNRLRTQGTANLIAAAKAAGVRRIVAESFIYVYGYEDRGETLLTEDDPLGASAAPAGLGPTVEALRSLEAQLLAANAEGGFETLALRFGLVYGPDNPGTRAMVGLLRRGRLPVVQGARGVTSFIHEADAVAAIVAALELGRSGRALNIVDDRPVPLATFLHAAAQALGAPPPRALPAWLMRFMAPVVVAGAQAKLPLSNARARAELAWAPAFPSYVEGWADIAAAGDRAR